MKRFFNLQNFLLLACLGLLVYLSGRATHLDQKISELARPAKLFSVSNVQSNFPHNPKWDVKISPDLDTFFYVISQQQFNWLGRGAQSVVFESQDGRYVLKLFQLSRLKSLDTPKSLRKKLLSSESDEKRLQRLNGRAELFSSSKHCYEELQDETGIVYVHLNRTNDKIKGIKLVDKFGQSHRIRGDDACFILQKKARYLIPTISNLMDSGKIDEAKARVDQLVDLLFTMAKKGYVDNDDALIRNNNIGYSEDRALYIDTGHLAKRKNINLIERMNYEFNVRLNPFEKWLDWTYPELAQYYREHREVVLSQVQALAQAQNTDK